MFEKNDTDNLKNATSTESGHSNVVNHMQDTKKDKKKAVSFPPAVEQSPNQT